MKTWRCGHPRTAENTVAYDHPRCRACRSASTAMAGRRYRHTPKGAATEARREGRPARVLYRIDYEANRRGTR